MNTLSTSTKIPLNKQILYGTPDDTQVNLLHDFFLRSLKTNFFYFPLAAQVHYQASFSIPILTARIESKRDLLLCAWDQKKIVGFISGTPPEGGVATIIWVSIDRDYQNQRIGAHLLNLAKLHYRDKGAHKIKLTVHDKKALTFYQRENFVIEAHHPNHWWNLDFWEVVYCI